jgi:hypothetical protein
MNIKSSHNSDKRLRTIHHLACTGGTVICKAINSMNNTIVISEINPNRLQYRFNPFDPTQLLLGNPRLQNNKALRSNIFLGRVMECHKISKNINCNLILRDHSDSDYMMAKDIGSIKNRSSLLDILLKHFDISSILSIRDPVESYISASSRGWTKSVIDFDDYCRRFELIVETYSSLGCKIVRYEDFCENPHNTMKIICEYFDISLNDNFEENFFKSQMTGDSGRGKSLKRIQTLEPKVLPQKLKDEALYSKAYLRIANMFNYGIGIIK